MASNVEESWWTDERRFKLAELTGSIYSADGLAMAAWRISQQFWGNGRKKIPVCVFKQIPQYELLFDVNLAVNHGSFVYIRGTRQFHEWYASLKESAANGGKTKAKRAKQIASERLANGYSPTLTLTLTPTLIQNQENQKLNLDQSDGSDRSKVRFDFESIYKKYPRKLGKQKGMQSCKSQIKTDKDYHLLESAIDRYVNHCQVNGIGPEFIKHFSTFMNSWRDWTDPEVGTSTLSPGELDYSRYENAGN